MMLIIYDFFPVNQQLLSTNNFTFLGDQPFKDLIKGMKMDTWKTRYENYEELVLYCYYVAVTGCLMALSIAGIAPKSDSSTESIYKAVVSLGIANQLTNILRDVGEE